MDRFPVWLRIALAAMLLGGAYGFHQLLAVLGSLNGSPS